MATTLEVVKMLLPNGGFVLNGDKYEDIEFIEAKPFTKKQFEDGFAAFDLWKSKQEEIKLSAKASAEAKLAALGLTIDDLKVLGIV